MKWGGVEINTERLKAANNGPTIEYRMAQLEASSGGGGGGGVHILTTPVSGRTYTNNLTAGSTSSPGVFATNRLGVTPFQSNSTFTATSFSFNVTTLGSSTNARILIFSDTNGKPSRKLLESTDISCATTGAKTYTAQFAFTKGTIYWIGVHSSNSATISGPAIAQTLPISSPIFGLGNPSMGLLTTSITYGSVPSTVSDVFTPSTSGLALIYIGV
jgi:hypothetical protein